ncbi:MAG: ATPase P [Proteobacteria bacterium]|nr:ATPase P [Desulfobacula sp.]MBU3953852.1 ATPase P [Pseudomonadota bacterium]MBU4133006.1 ATPase P [Pseudomonadota bacterium]
MIHIQIPGSRDLTIENILLDFNGTLAVDGRLIEGVRERIAQFSDCLNFHVITADTFGSVKKELEELHCFVHIIPEQDQASSKLSYLQKLGPENTIGVGNGANDERMLQEAVLGVAVLGQEGLATKTLMASNLAVNHILDLFAYFEKPDRLIACLRE